MEEVELVVMGTVEKWRVERQFAYMIVLSAGTLKFPPTATEMFPLPYDDELTDNNNELNNTNLAGQAAESYYNSVKATWN